MKKIITIAGIIIVALVLIFVLSKNMSFTPTAETNLDKIQINPNMSDITLSLSSDPKEIAWAVFQKYLGYNKDKNLDAVKSIVYKVNSICTDKIATNECKNRMDLAYAYGKDLKKEDFINVWSDNKQTILATNFNTDHSRAIIFFIGDLSNLKLLSFSPIKHDEEQASSTLHDTNGNGLWDGIEALMN